MKRIFYSCVLFLIACNNEGHPAEAKADHARGVEQSTLGDAHQSARAALGALLAHYLHIKDGLSNNDSRFAASGAKALSKDLKELDRSKFTKEEAELFERVQEQMLDLAGHIADSEKKIDHQREHFRKLSDDFYFLVKSLGYGGLLYVWRDSTTNDDTSQLWLTDSADSKKTVINPFTGIANTNPTISPAQLGR